MTKTSSGELNRSLESPKASTSNLSDSFGSPKSTDSKKSSSDTKNRRKRKPKKVSLSANEGNEIEPMEIETNLPIIPVISNPALNLVVNSSSRTDSDECETIDKIAKMVSNITSEQANIPINVAPPEDQQEKLLNDVSIFKSYN